MRRLFVPAIGLLVVAWLGGSLLVRPMVSAIPDQLSGKIVSSVIDNPTTVITPPYVPPGGTGQPSVPVSGTAQPNTKVKIINNGRAVASGQTNSDGKFNVQTPLDMGNNQITVQTPSGAPSNQVNIKRHSNSWWYHHRWQLFFGSLGAILASLIFMGFIHFRSTGQLWPGGKKRILGGDDDDEE